MAYVFETPQLGLPPITSTILATQTAGGPRPWKLGDIVRAVDPTYGAGEFIYLAGLAGTIVGSWVTYNPDDWTTALLVPDAIGPIAVAMSANLAGYDGWYQIHGKAIGACLTLFADNAQVWITSTSGKVDDTSVAGDLVQNAKGASLTVVGSGLAEFEIARPWVNNFSSGS